MKIVFFVVFVAALSASNGASIGSRLGGPAGKCPEIDGENCVYLMDTKSWFVYYQCTNGVPIAMSCNSGLVFNPRNNNCDRLDPEAKEYGPVGECPKEDGEDVYLRDGANQSVMYHCEAGTPQRRTCEVGTVFNPYTYFCC